MAIETKNPFLDERGVPRQGYEKSAQSWQPRKSTKPQRKKQEKTPTRIKIHLEDLLFDTVVFDLETTGLNTKRDEIIQIAGVRIINGVVRHNQSFESYVQPKRRIPDFVEYLTGISNDDVRYAPNAASALAKFSEWCGDSLLIGHNCNRFDNHFLRRQSGRRKRLIRCLDAMHLSWLIWGREKGTSHGLDSVVERIVRERRDQAALFLYNTLNGAERHTALGDAKILADTVLALRNILSETHLGPRWLPAQFTQIARSDTVSTGL